MLKRQQEATEIIDKLPILASVARHEISKMMKHNLTWTDGAITSYTNWRDAMKFRDLIIKGSYKDGRPASQEASEVEMRWELLLCLMVLCVAMQRASGGVDTLPTSFYKPKKRMRDVPEWTAPLYREFHEWMDTQDPNRD